MDTLRHMIMNTNRRVFDWTTHQRFADISCDHNPIHMDAVAARRTLAGAPIVHGIHSLIWILECFSQSNFGELGVKSLRAQFLQPVYVGDEVTLNLSKPNESVVRARLTVGCEDVLLASIGFDGIEHQGPFMPEGGTLSLMPPNRPNNLNLEEMERLSGQLSFGPMIHQIRTLFPNAVRVFGMQRIAALVCSSCLVGMVVPGLHSMFSGLEVSFSEDGTASAAALQFVVTSVAERFRLVRVAINGGGLRGSLETVNRLPPVRQPSIDSIMPLVARDEFRNSTALIVGGSRGLGELTAKLIAAGGGRVVITYMTGKDDANAVVDELRGAGFKCDAVAYDVRRSAREPLPALGVIPTHVYYFATPRIFRRKTALFDLGRFEEFNSFYVTGFFDLVTSCARLRPGGIRVFYPSSTFIDSRPAAMTEYAMSKAAAELLCSDLSKLLPGVQVLARRLPRLPTDQTSSVAQINRTNPIDVILPIVREMHLAI
jgi:hypothetical protein